VQRSSARQLFSLDTIGQDPLIGKAVEQVGPQRAMEIADTVWSYRIEAEKPA